MIKKSLYLFSPLFFILPLSVAISVKAVEDVSRAVTLEDTPARVQNSIGTPYTFSIYGLAETSFLTTFPDGDLTSDAGIELFSFSGPFLLEQQLGVAFGFHIYEEASPFARGFLGAGLCLLVERCTLWLQAKAFVGLGFGIQSVQVLSDNTLENDVTVPFAIRSGGALSFALTYGEETFSFGPYVEGFVYNYQLQDTSTNDLVDYGAKGAIEIGLMAIFGDILYLRAGYHHSYDRYEYALAKFPDIFYEHRASNGFRLALGLILGGAVIGQRF